MKRSASLCIAALSLGLLSFVASSEAGKKKTPEASASPSTTATATASPATKTVRGIPFHGMISAVDGKAKTFTIAGRNGARVFKISNETTVTKQGATATMKEVVEKEEVRGLYRKEADGSMQALLVKVGPLTAEEKAAEAARKAKRAERRAAKAAAASASATASPAASPSASP